MIAELLKSGIAELIAKNIEKLEIDTNLIVESKSVILLSRIQEIIKNEALSDFEALEQIVCIFEEHDIDCGFRHDF